MVDPFEWVPIGQSGVEVTRLGLGGAPLSGMVLADGLFGGVEHDEAIAIVERAYELGVRYFDTAPLYGEGRSEVRYGKGLADADRAEVAISTKVDRLLVAEDPADLSPAGPDGLPRLKTEFNFTRAGILKSLEQSLHRLNMDSIDIVYVHDSDFSGQHPDERFIEALEVVSELRSEGVVQAIGLGMNEWELTTRMIQRFDLDIVLLAGRYTLLDQSALGQLMPLCQARNVAVAIGGPYNSGILASDLNGPVSFDYVAAPPEWISKARRIKEVCDRWGVDVRATALQFPFAHPAVATIIPAASRSGWPGVEFVRE